MPWGGGPWVNTCENMGDGDCMEPAKIINIIDSFIFHHEVDKKKEKEKEIE